jgi:hypothetical protein
MDAEHYAKRSEAPPWIIEASARHLADLLRYHDHGHGEITLRPLWARTGAQHGTTKKERTDA